MGQHDANVIAAIDALMALPAELAITLCSLVAEKHGYRMTKDPNIVTMGEMQQVLDAIKDGQLDLKEDENPEGVEAICENCGKPCDYHSKMCLCDDCQRAGL
jgi:hypothetical protein